jgi:catechol 2,3-dioxygenase-like lactoylglutathione lyase family enzyme
MASTCAAPRNGEDRAKAEETTMPGLPSRLHHYAFVVKDHEVNRAFFEDVLGIPLVATWCEKHYSPNFGREVEFCHTFFGLADGGALAFFQFADDEAYAKTRNVDAEVPFYRHIALKVDDETFNGIEARLGRAGLDKRVIDHGYCKSIYCTSPDGLIVEFTVDPPDAERIADMRRADAHAELKRWLAGDRRVNNDVRVH